MDQPETDMGGRLADLDMLELVFQASPLVQAVLLLLVLLSVFSWAVILYKTRELKRAEQDSEAFLEIYHDGSLEETYDAARALDRSPLAAMFAASYGELRRLARSGGGAVTLDENALSALSSRAQWAGSRESKRLERGLTFLATTGSAAPFIGLFGTVIGIIGAFQGIGRAGSASLAGTPPQIWYPAFGDMYPTRLDAYIAPSRCILGVGDPMVTIWFQDSRARSRFSSMLHLYKTNVRANHI